MFPEVVSVVSAVAAAMSAAVAVLALVSSWGSRRDSRRSADAAELSMQAARTSADAAVRAADAAEKANVLQERGLLAEEAERRRRTQAQIVPVKWEPSNRADLRGLILKNDGHGIATDVWGVLKQGDQFRRGLITSIGVGQTSNILELLQEFVPDAEDVGELPEGRILGRARWQNEDGSSGDSGWIVLVR